MVKRTKIESTLKACPFCKKSSNLHQSWNEDCCYIVCRDCGARGPEVLAWDISDPVIAEAWNNRA